MNENKKPSIRFKEFTATWRQYKLGEIGTVSMCRRIFKNQTSENGDIPFYKIGTFGGEPDAFISTKLFEEYKAKYPYPKKGDILISASGSIGRTVEFTGKDEYFQDSNIVWLNHNECLDDSFLKYFYSIVKWSGIEGSTIKRLYNDNILNTTINLPTIEEQKKIGEYFNNFDHLITLYQQKLKKLENIKKSILEKMFPLDKKNIPEIRFSGFSEVWEQHKLSESCIVFNDGDWIEAKDQSSEGIRLIQTGNIGITQYIDKSNNAKWISEETFNRLKCKEIFEGDILISRLPEPAGRACIVPNLGTKMITVVDCTIIRTLPEVSNKYLVQYLSTEKYFNKVNICLAGGTRQRISKRNLSAFNIPIPASYKEQEYIGLYFENLDHLIILQQQKLEKLKNIKKSMLEKMFV